MKSNQLNLFVLFVVTMVGYPFGIGFAAPDGSRPDDFSISYQYNSGSVPPPYYYEYTITMTPAGQGEIQLVPDHAAESVPQWTETFELDDQTIDELYSLLVSEGAFSNNWQEASPPRLGAPSEVVQITAQGQQMQIPAQVAGEQNRTKDKLTKAIKALVPESVWQSLKNRHTQYSKEHYPDGSQ